jgi:hypothetical protein
MHRLLGDVFARAAGTWLAGGGVMVTRFCLSFALLLLSSGCTTTVDDAPEVTPQDAPTAATRPDQMQQDTVRLWSAVLTHGRGGGHETAPPHACPAHRPCERLQHWDDYRCVCTPNASCRPHQGASCPDGFVCIEDSRGCAPDDGLESCLGICVEL